MQVPTKLLEFAADPARGAELHTLASELFPICRSITGDGVRQTLDVLAQHIPLVRHTLPTGTKVLDWEVPQEWSIRDAYIKNAAGQRVVDFKTSNLHVVSYSTPVRARMSWSALRPHLHSLPNQPDLIPYRTSYYSETWGFCVSHNQLQALEREGGEFDVCIDATLAPGALTWGEVVHQGATSDEIVLTAHVCHPSLANDNCSGLALLAHLGAALTRLRTRYSYRLLFIPGTIGSIAWLSQNERNVGRIKHGLVLSCVGDGGGPIYKKSRRGDAVIDRVMTYVLKADKADFIATEFFPYGYDERQFCSPGFNLPFGLFQRSQFATFPEYHTSADNLDFIKPEHLAQSLKWIARALHIIETDGRFQNLSPKGEPQLGRRGLYGALGGDKDAWKSNMAMLWVLNLSDGSHSLLDIAERANIDFETIARIATTLSEHGLLAPAD